MYSCILGCVFVMNNVTYIKTMLTYEVTVKTVNTAMLREYFIFLCSVVAIFTAFIVSA